MLIPQAMAYATLAGVPPVYGLYSSILSLFIYPIFATSPQLAVGPVAMMSILTYAAVGDVAAMEGIEERSDRWVNLSLKMAMLVGLVQLVMGLLRAGFLVNFLSHPVLKGFTSAAAIIIGSSQLGKVLGFKVTSDPKVYMVWKDVIEKLGKTNKYTLALTLESLALFILLKYLKQVIRRTAFVKSRKVLDRLINAIPNALIVVIINILIVWSERLDLEKVAIIGKVPAGFPSTSNPFDDQMGTDIGHLIVPSIITGLVGFMESISVAKALALKYGSDLDSNQELVGLGAANVFGSFFFAFPTTGGFSRTSVNADAGAQTTIAGLISAVILSIVVVALTDLFFYLPDATLGSLIIFAVAGLIELDTPKMLWRVDKMDFFVYLIAFVATILLGIEEGILIGCGVSIVRIIKESASPHVAVLGQLPDQHTWRNVKRFPDSAKEEPGLKVVRFDSHLYFANAGYFRDLILKLATPQRRSDAPPRAIVVDMGGVVTIDSSSVHMLETMPAELRKHAIKTREDRLEALERRLQAARAGALSSSSGASLVASAHHTEHGGSTGATATAGMELVPVSSDAAKPAGAGVGAGAAAAAAEVAVEVAPAEAAEASETQRLLLSEDPAEWLAAIGHGWVPPQSDDDALPNDPAVLQARIEMLRKSPLRVPVLFLASVRGPVRDVFHVNEEYLHDAKKALERAAKGNVLTRCLFNFGCECCDCTDCRSCSNGDGSCCSSAGEDKSAAAAAGTPRVAPSASSSETDVTKVERSLSLAAADHLPEAGSSAAAAASGAATPALPPTSYIDGDETYPVDPNLFVVSGKEAALSFSLQDDDISDAVRHVKQGLLRHYRNAVANRV